MPLSLLGEHNIIPITSVLYNSIVVLPNPATLYSTLSNLKFMYIIHGKWAKEMELCRRSGVALDLIFVCTIIIVIVK